jgi:hypothetical protein
MPLVLPANSPKVFHNFRSETATINIDYKMGGYKNITVSGKTTGTGRWRILGTNDENGSKVPQNFQELVASAVTLISSLDSYRWIRAEYTLGNATTGEIAISGIRG